MEQSSFVQQDVVIVQQASALHAMQDISQIQIQLLAFNVEPIALLVIQLIQITVLVARQDPIFHLQYVYHVVRAVFHALDQPHLVLNAHLVSFLTVELVLSVQETVLLVLQAQYARVVGWDSFLKIMLAEAAS